MLRHSISSLKDEKARLENMLNNFPELKNDAGILQIISDLKIAIDILSAPDGAAEKVRRFASKIKELEETIGESSC